MKSGTCPKCNQRNICKAVTPPGLYHGNDDTYACSDCHYTETYLLDEAFPKPLDTYEGWERVSPPADGPFR